MLKRFARWLLKEEIKKLEDKVESYRSELKNITNGHARLSRSFADEIEKTKAQLDASMKERERLKEENDLMRVYYKVDEEPSEEEKMKIHIDLRIHQLERELDAVQRELIAERINRSNSIPIQYSYPPVWMLSRPY